MRKIVREGQGWRIGNIAISHKVGKLKVGEVNLVVAVASAHRSEGFAVYQFKVIDPWYPSLKV